ncbi:alpha-amylase family protein [Vibrio cholerae]|nr:alpha-amylase family protein [Vibrio cholerae]
MKQKKAIYQVFTRLFGNKNQNFVRWGTLEENGVGKFSDFTDTALAEIRNLGITHIWYTGVLHHALVRDYSAYGIHHDHPAVVKGRAGSPYAIKDYYSVNPDLADDPAHRLDEFISLINRTHQHGMKVIIDIVPNHVARNYRSQNNPLGTSDFGANDNPDVEYHRDNNFYYLPNQPFELPDYPNDYQPLGENALMGWPSYKENPAKWTGNGARKAKPAFDDWYETVKINYGVRPDGTKDFPSLPAGYERLTYREHHEFWQNQELPDSWHKFRDIALFWLSHGVDGFRYDMAEMVPIEFWSYLNSTIKIHNPEAILVAEVYQPERYRDYLHLGKMDYLYDKVDLYDSLKGIIQSKESTQEISRIQQKMSDIEHHMLHFVENHDEQRLAAPEFAGNPEWGKPAMLVSVLISSAPSMVYFGQEVGEDGSEDAGFGRPSRTSIFDYIGVPEHQKWMNNGLFDGEQLSDRQRDLRAFYARLLNFSLQHPALCGQYWDLYSANAHSLGSQAHAFARSCSSELIIVLSHFEANTTRDLNLTLPAELIRYCSLPDGTYTLVDEIGLGEPVLLQITQGIGQICCTLKPFAAHAYLLEKKHAN